MSKSQWKTALSSWGTARFYPQACHQTGPAYQCGVVPRAAPVLRKRWVSGLGNTVVQDSGARGSLCLKTWSEGLCECVPNWILLDLFSFECFHKAHRCAHATRSIARQCVAWIPPKFPISKCCCMMSHEAASLCRRYSFWGTGHLASHRGCVQSCSAGTDWPCTSSSDEADCQESDTELHMLIVEAIMSWYLILTHSDPSMSCQCHGLRSFRQISRVCTAMKISQQLRTTFKPRIKSNWAHSGRSTSTAKWRGVLPIRSWSQLNCQFQKDPSVYHLIYCIRSWYMLIPCKAVPMMWPWKRNFDGIVKGWSCLGIDGSCISLGPQWKLPSLDRWSCWDLFLRWLRCNRLLAERRHVFAPSFLDILASSLHLCFHFFRTSAHTCHSIRMRQNEVALGYFEHEDDSVGLQFKHLVSRSIRMTLTFPRRAAMCKADLNDITSGLQTT